MPTVVLVTGVGGRLGARVAAGLAADTSIERVIGVDTALPPGHSPLGRAEFVRVDIRNPIIGRIIDTADVDTVVHPSIASPPATGGGRSAIKEMTVIGTMQLLAACQRSESVRRLVAASTTAVYGTGPFDPAVFTEDAQPSTPHSGHAGDAAEIEGYLRGFARRRPDIGQCVLRMADMVGPTVVTPLTRYLSPPLVPTVLGFDPRVQLLHEDDAVAVLVRAAQGEYSGVVNVAGHGAMVLSQVIRRAGRIALPVPAPAAAGVEQLLYRLGRHEQWPGPARFPDFGRVVDTTRLRDGFGYRIRYSTAEALAEFIRGAGLRPVLAPGPVRYAERLLGGLLAGGSGD